MTTPDDNAPRFAPLPKAERDQLAQLLTKRHRNHLAPGERFTVEGHLSHGEVALTMRLAPKDEGDTLTLEGKIDLVANDLQDPNEARFLLMDFLDEVFQTYFEQERLMPLDLAWRAYTFQEVEVLHRSERNNPHLESLADAILAAGAPGGDA